MANVDTQAEFLAEGKQMSLGNTVAFIAIRARIPVRTANSRMMPKHAGRNTKDSTNPEAQHITGLKMTPPSLMPLEQMENVKMQLTVNIKASQCPWLE